MFRRLFLGLAAAAAVLSGPASAAGPANHEAAALDLFLERFSAYGYSFSLLVARDDRVVLNRAYGPGLTTRSVFNVASVAKQFTATAVLKLAEDGRLSLADPVSRHLPDAPAAFERVTLDHLLAHTSGIRDDYGLYQREPDLDRDAFRARIFARSLGSPPGEKWSYCNDCYALLAMIVERASGRPFTEFVRERLFRPAGMKDSGFMGDRWPDDRRPATFGGSIASEPRTNRWVGCLGAGCVVTNPSDLYRWHLAMASGRILSEPFRAKLTEPRHAVFPPVLTYARGWWLRRADLPSGPTTNIFHSGLEDDGASAWYSRFPDQRTTLIFASHQGWEGMPLREALFAAANLSPLESILFGGEVRMPPPPVAIGGLNRFAGRYVFEDGSWLAVEAEPPFLRVTPHGQAAFDRLVPAGGHEDTPKVLAVATDRTEAILRALAAGDPGPFAKAVGERDDGATLSPPRFSAFEVLGSYPVRLVTPRRRELITHARLTVDGASQHYRFAWSGETLTSLWADDQPAVPRFRAVAANRFANLHPLELRSAYVGLDGEALIVGTERAARTP